MIDGGMRRAAFAAAAAAVLALSLAMGLPSVRPSRIVLAGPGAVPVAVVIPDDATPAEQTAARELVAHLEVATDRSLSILFERDFRSGRPAIHVGGTAWASARGIDCAARGDEGWLARGVGSSLVLCGGRPRGTLYAVYRFLEDQVGVRWWTPFDTDIPRHDALGFDVLDTGGAPRFEYRDINAAMGPREFYACSRLNGHFSGLRAAHGGSERYGPPRQVHTFFDWVPPDEFFDDHPGYFSEIGGMRWADDAQLCLSADGLDTLVAERILAAAAGADAAAAEGGNEPPRLYDVSANDWGKPCDCELCAAANAREGARSGALVAFVNSVAEQVRARRPGLLVGTLAYGWSFAPPREAAPAPDVIIRFAPLYGRDFSRPLADPVHRPLLDALDAWAARTRHLRIWDYAVTYGDAGDLPRPDLSWIAEDLRLYLARGVEGIFVQQDPPVDADMLDLERFVLARLMEDPERNATALIRDFTDGYYGPAGAAIRDYLAALNEAALRRPGTLPFDGGAEAFPWLDAHFLAAAHARFDEAERLVANDSRKLERVQHARIGIDAATLHRWPFLVREGRTEGIGALDSLDSLDGPGVLARWRETMLREIARRLDPARAGEARADVESQADVWRRMLGV